MDVDVNFNKGVIINASKLTQNRVNRNMRSVWYNCSTTPLYKEILAKHELSPDPSNARANVAFLSINNSECPN